MAEPSLNWSGFSILFWFLLFLTLNTQIIELRRHRRGDWPRDHARLRRQGTPVRQGWQHEAMVEQRDRATIPPASPVRHRPVLELRTRRHQDQRERTHDTG